MIGASNHRTSPRSVFDTNVGSSLAWRHRPAEPELAAQASCRSRPRLPVPDLTVAVVAASANAGCGSLPPGTHSAAATPDSPAPLHMPAAVPTCRPLPFGQFIMAD